MCAARTWPKPLTPTTHEVGLPTSHDSPLTSTVEVKLLTPLTDPNHHGRAVTPLTDANHHGRVAYTPDIIPYKEIVYFNFSDSTHQGGAA